MNLYIWNKKAIKDSKLGSRSTWKVRWRSLHETQISYQISLRIRAIKIYFNSNLIKLFSRGLLNFLNSTWQIDDRQHLKDLWWWVRKCFNELTNSSNVKILIYQMDSVIAKFNYTLNLNLLMVCVLSKRYNYKWCQNLIEFCCFIDDKINHSNKFY